MARYSGQNLYVSFAGTALANIRSIEDSDEANEIDASAAGDTREQYLAGLLSGTWSAEMLDDNSSNDPYTAVAPQTTGTLIIAPEGTSAGKRKITYNSALALSRSRSYPYDDVVMINAEGRLNSAPTLGTY